MSSIRKSASFRSRIPVRRTRVPVRRCSSPQPSSSTTNSYRQHTRKNQWYDRRYSSSSYSSSDESHESEAPLQLLINQSVITSGTMARNVNNFNVSTDAMSLDGLLDSVSSGSFSCPSSPKPKIYTDQVEEKIELLSSYESLDKFNYALETLKITDDFHENHKVMNFLQNNVMADDQKDEDVKKQKQLSDWYYIKTSPKPKQKSPYERRKYNNNNKKDEALSSSNKKLNDLSINLNGSGEKKNSIQQQDVENNKILLSKVLIDNQSHKISSIDKKDNYNFDTNANKFSSPVFNSKFYHQQLTENQFPSANNTADHNKSSPKCFNLIKFNRTGKKIIFGDMTSSSFEHVNVDSFLPEMCPGKVLNSAQSNRCVQNQYENHQIRSDKQQQTEFFKYKNALNRPLPQVPTTMDNKYYPTKTNQQQITTPTSYRTECELSGSYVSLECPSPPGPPACLSDNRRDPQARLARYLKTLYTELALKEPVAPTWAQPVALGSLCPARLEPELRLHINSHGINECISVDQLLTAVQTNEGPFLEAPRRVVIECPPWVTRSSLALRILHGWSREPPWPPRGLPVAIALFIPLNELKGTIANYISKELLPRGPPNPFASGFGGFNSAWNTLESLKGKLLIVLDGYDGSKNYSTKNKKNKNAPQDVLDLLEGRMFPESRIIVISITSNCTDLLPLMQRHVTYEGLTWGRSASLLGGGQWGAPTRLLDTVQDCTHLRNIARTSLGCLAISAIYETTGGDLPTDEIDVVESLLNCVTLNSSQVHIAELGRLALFILKTKRATITSAELKMYCSSPESNIIGCLDKAPLFGRSAKRKCEYNYTTICPEIAEFLAANYLVSLSSRPGLLAAEIAGLSIGDEVEPEILKVLTYSMALLGTRAHLLLSKLTPLWLSPQTIFSLALAGGETESNLTSLCELLGISKSPPIPPLEAKPIWVQIKSSPNELQGWGLAFKSPTCTLKNLELVYQIEKNMMLESKNGMDIFLDALSKNESVTTLRITSLIENDVRDADINYLATCIARALLKPRLENFELILTLLEEDPPILKLQSVVTALCRSIPRQAKLGSLILDLGLCTSQLVQICSALEKCPHVTRLSFPHLRCERGAVGALAALLNARPLSYLALPSCWGARDDPPSSSGVSMGSGSGSSSGNSGLIKQSSLTQAPSPRSYPPGLFSSLPRGVLNSTNNLGRSATLPRQPAEGPPDKRSSDSVISRTWYPTPACDGGPHNSGTLHELLVAARESFSRLHGLDLSKAQLSLEDSMCLGETVRVSTTLHSIKLEGASRLSEILPTVLGASESPSLQMMSLGSPRLALEDAAVGMSARALGSCITLRLLSLDGWSFRIENISTLASVRGFLSLTSIRELGLSNCRLHLPMFKSDIVMPQGAYECRSVVNLKLAGAQVILSDHVPLRGPQLLPYLIGFVYLRELDLSAPARSGLGGSTSAPLILGDKCLIGFFNTLNTHFSSLNTLKICNWIIHLDDAVKTLKTVSKTLKSSTISHIKLDGLSVMDRPKKLRIEPQLMHVILSSLPLLRWMGITVAGMNEEQITSIGNYCADIKGMEIDIRLSESTIENARLMTQSLGLDGKFDIRVSTFGTSNSILIHIEKTSTKSLSRNK